MNVTIERGTVSGNIAAPPSKSHTQRVYAAALLHKGRTIIHGAGNSDDEEAAFNVIQQLGATTSVAPLTITSNGINPTSPEISCGESGLCARLFTPIAALAGKAITVSGTGTLLQRPITGFEKILPQLNVSLPGFNGLMPFIIQGPMTAGPIKLDASDSSQFLTGLLFALSYCANETVTIEVTGLKSKPYIDLTLDVLAQFGKPVGNDDYLKFTIDPSSFTYCETIQVTVEGDWSNAAFLLAAGAIAGSITVSNLDLNSKQADKVIVDILRDAGAALQVTGNSVSVTKAPLRSFEIDATDCPDLFPVLSVLAAYCKGESYIKGVHRLFHKESNRAESISEMLENFGVSFSIEDDTLCITGANRLNGTVVDSFHDHRIVMAASIAALGASSRVDIRNAEAVNKSYPAFFNDLARVTGRR
jgi:3-phosphoshikimate 1-carboxyvinyltransferase